MICLVNIYQSRFTFNEIEEYRETKVVVGGIIGFAESLRETINQLGIYGIMTLEAKYVNSIDFV